MESSSKSAIFLGAIFIIVLVAGIFVIRNKDRFSSLKARFSQTPSQNLVIKPTPTAIPTQGWPALPTKTPEKLTTTNDVKQTPQTGPETSLFILLGTVSAASGFYFLSKKS
jgi:hypothetical protein